MPYAFAPEVQKQVPFIAWFGADLAARRGLDTACIGRLLDTPFTHDNLYHSALGCSTCRRRPIGATSTRSRRAARPVRRDASPRGPQRPCVRRR
jgi:glucan phosphoethanolaminetransferase (alkaline phosphatase superfamily)